MRVNAGPSNKTLPQLTSQNIVKNGSQKFLHLFGGRTGHLVAEIYILSIIDCGTFWKGMLVENVIQIWSRLNKGSSRKWQT